jgi:hypothetical protein
MNDKFSTPSLEPDPVRDRAIRLFAFLREMSLLRTKVVRSVEEYEKVVWLGDIPTEPGCHCAAWGTKSSAEDTSTWIELRKPRLAPYPEPPDDLAPWLAPDQLADSSREFPELRETARLEDPSNPEGPPVAVNLSDCPDTKPLWEHYVETVWWPWAEQDRRAQRVQAVYTSLFSIYQKQRRLAEIYEVVLGFGLLSWKPDGGNEIKRHVVTAQANLEFDAKRGVVTVEVGAEGAKLKLEQDMLDPQDQPGPAHQNVFQQELTQAGDDVWGAGIVRAVVHGWITALNPYSRFEDTLGHGAVCSPTPMLQFAPALILRRRTERSLIQVFEKIKQELEAGGPLPMGVRRLVDVVEDADSRFGSPGERGDCESSDDEIYFPLPANDEQLRIVKRLARRAGVVVQGPPGTGKSHTIANLICHLLASGQRVLVTSQTPRALKVLSEKIPGPVKPLCVSLLGDDQEAMASLDDSVRGIIDRQVQWDRERSDKTAKALRSELDAARKREAETLSILRQKREAEAHPQRLPGGYCGTAQQIARAVRQKAPALGWLIDAQPGTEAPPFTDAEACELLDLLRRIGEDREREAEGALVAPDL